MNARLLNLNPKLYKDNGQQRSKGPGIAADVRPGKKEQKPVAPFS